MTDDATAVVRLATPDDALAVRRILDGAMLAIGDVETRIAGGDVFVGGDRRGTADAVDEGRRADDRDRRGRPDDGDRRGRADDGDRSNERERLLGALVLEPRERGAHVSAVAVRRRHRGRGIATALVERALERERRLTARFDGDVRPFYDSLEFDVEPVGDGRFRGVAVAHG